MRQYEITYKSTNGEHWPKPITAVVIEPDACGPETGAMLFTHGWSGNRYQNMDQMLWAVEHFDVVGMAVEYRQSGYDFDPVAGVGYDRPYDASFYQVFDVLNGLRTLLELRPGINGRRLFHYGVSQGGHIALLSTIFAPQTFAFVYASSPITHLAELDQGLAGRTWSFWELALRDVRTLAEHIDTPLFIEHGGNDARVPHDTHCVPLAEKLEALDKEYRIEYIEGAGHSLAPVTTRLAMFQEHAPDPLRMYERESKRDDFVQGSTVRIAAAGRTLAIDWRRPPESEGLIRIEPR